ncbi:MAG: hypothetical protein KDA61_00660 [Planctomycetales bacterium]|nr:hypothetical protein [Planctomycetales bacterium]
MSKPSRKPVSRTPNPAKQRSFTWQLADALRRVAFAMVVGVVAQPAAAINIVMQLQQEGMNPSYDPSGAKLKAIANAAAAYWEDYLPESGTYEVDIWWDTDELSGSTLGRWNFQVGGDNNIRINADPRDGDGNQRDWYIDPTPMDNSEYDFATQNRWWSDASNRNVYGGGAWLYRDLDGSEQSGWFDGNVPSVTEVGYRGRATSSLLLEDYDLLSTVIHEIGHELGVNSTGGPWDADPSWVPGGSATFLEDNGHLAARSSLMCDSCGMLGTRRLPSAIDIMSAADDEDMTWIDLPRKYYVGSGMWNDPGHWVGGRLPDSNDDVFFVDNNFAMLTMGTHIQNLTLDNGSDVNVQSGVSLTVDETVYVGSVGSDSNLWINNGTTLNVERLRLDGGKLQLNDGHLVANGAIVITDASVGGGQIATFGGQVDTYDFLINDGEIIAFGGTTTFSHLGGMSEPFDLDGVTGTGEVRALLGDFVFNDALLGTFESQMTVLDGHSITVNSDWVFGEKSELRFDTGTSGPATFDGNGIPTFRGVVNAAGLSQGSAVLATPSALFKKTSRIKIGGGDRLILDTLADFDGGVVDGQGTLEQQGNIVVHDDVEINVPEFDWGNSSVQGLHEITVLENRLLRVNSRESGTPRNEYRGVIDLQGGKLHVAMDAGWLLPRRDKVQGEPAPGGTLLLRSSRKQDPAIVTGTPLTVEGEVKAYGGASLIHADFLTTPQASVESTIGADLQLTGKTTYNGGNIYGLGSISQWGDANVVGNTTIGTSHYDWDGGESFPSTTHIAPEVKFTIAAQDVDKSGGSYDGRVEVEGGTLDVQTPGGWSVGPAGSMRLANVQGPAMVLGTPIDMHGVVETQGGNEILSSVTFHNDARVDLPQSGDMLRLRGHTNYEGGSYFGQGGVIQDATAFVNAATAMNLGFFDLDGVGESSLVELHDDLTLNVDRIDLNDNRFNGVLEVTDSAVLGINTPEAWEMAGALNVAGGLGTTLRIEGAPVKLFGNVTIHPDNTLELAADVSGTASFSGPGTVKVLGDYSPGASPALVHMAGDFVVDTGASLTMELGGTSLGSDYDHVEVVGDATLGGSLNVSLLTDAAGDTFVPEVGQQFALMHALGSLGGGFDQVFLPVQVGALGLAWELDYSSHWVNLRVADVFEIAMPGDFDEDGDVDKDDLAVWESQFGDAGLGLTSDENQNGYVDGPDFMAWQSHFGGSVSANVAQSAIPEPTGTLLATLAVSVLVATRRSRTRGVSAESFA